MRILGTNWPDRLLAPVSAGLFASAIATSAALLMPLGEGLRWGVSAVLGFVAFAASRAFIVRVGRVAPQALSLTASDLLSGVAAQPLELPDDDRQPVDPDLLELDDQLPTVGQDSRVVRLFGPSAQPTAGELKARIDRHLAERSAGAAADETAAMVDALNDLRRDVRRRLRPDG